MSINNREDANKYYQVINDLVDDYIDTWKIKPSNLKKYLKPGGERFNRFLEKNKLKDIAGSERILQDIIDDRFHMERDGIIKFESFKFFESDEFKILSMKECLYKGIEKATPQMEKILADHFDTSLGDIDIVDSGKHIFKLNSWDNNDQKVIIYSKEDIKIIKNNFIDFLYSELCTKKVDLVNDISINLNNLIKKDIFETEISTKFTSEYTLKTISIYLGSGFNYNTEKNGYFMWIS